MPTAIDERPEDRTVASSTPVRIQPYRWHLLVCTGPRCAPAESEALFERLGERLRAHGLASGPERAKRTRCSCFAVCRDGPILVVYPGGTWYARVTPERLERIVVEHLKGGVPVREAMVHPAGAES
jgi:(2Fe-2S) ferredoxin